MCFLGKSKVNQPRPEVIEMMNFLNEMANAQSKRFDALAGQIEELKKEVLRLQEMQKNALVAPLPKAEAAVAPAVAVRPLPQQAPAEASPVAEAEAASVAAPKKTVYPPLIYGSPDGAGFEASDKLSSRDDNRALYVVERISETEANFYPLADRFHRLRSNASSFFLPLCNVSGDLDSSIGFKVDPSGYGKLKLTDGYWEMTEKCSVKCL